MLREGYDRIYGVCRRLTGNDADAADAAQEALIAIARGIERFDGRSKVSTWMYRIAVNASIDEMRRRRRRPTETLESVPTLLSTVSEDAIAGSVDIDAALRRIPLEFRAPVVLRDLSGLDYEEIAEVLGLAAGTVKSRISRGRAMLARHLDPSAERP